MWNGTAEILKARPGEQEHQAEDQAESTADACTAAAMPANVDGAGEAVDQRGAVEQHARRQRAEDEILQAGLGRAHRVAAGSRRARRARATAARGRDRARSGRWPRSSSSCRAWPSRTRIRILEALATSPRAGSRRDMSSAAAEPISASSFMKRAKAIDDEGAAEGRQLARPAAARRSHRRRPESAATASPSTTGPARSPRERAEHQQHQRARQHEDVPAAAGAKAGDRRAFIGLISATTRPLAGGRARPRSCATSAVDRGGASRRGPAPDRSRTGW